MALRVRKKTGSKAAETKKKTRASRGTRPSSQPNTFLEDDDSAESLEALDLAVDERKLVTQPYDYSVDQLGAHVEKGKIVLMEVPYQREYVWDETKASRLIESLLLNVPIPVCYFAENEDNSWEVIDGLQRVHSIVRFLKGELRLRGLTVLKELNDKTTSEIPGRDLRRIESRTLRFVVITQESHPDIKFDVFERLNTGAVKLLPQELRNCIYRGTFNDSLHEIVEDPSYRTALGRPRDSRMRDEELALRFLALYSGLPGYKPPLAQFLNEFMRKNRTKIPDPAAVEVFKASMHTIASVFGSSAFSTLREGKHSSNINRALFDAVALSVAFSQRRTIEKNAASVRRVHAELLGDATFLPLIARATADRSRMHSRVRDYTQKLKSVGVKSKLPDLPDE